jgi:hypothetical protein
LGQAWRAVTTAVKARFCVRNTTGVASGQHASEVGIEETTSKQQIPTGK